MYAVQGRLRDGQSALPYAEVGIWILDSAREGGVYTAFAPVGSVTLAIHSAWLIRVPS